MLFDAVEDSQNKLPFVPFFPDCKKEFYCRKFNITKVDLLTLLSFPKTTLSRMWNQLVCKIKTCFFLHGDIFNLHTMLFEGIASNFFQDFFEIPKRLCIT